MSDKKLKLTVQESRHLFSSLQQNLLKVCEEELTEFRGPEQLQPAGQYSQQSQQSQKSQESGNEAGSLWPALENELRAAYEMSRFGMSIVDLDDDIANIDVFRGNCEDYAGIEPINEDLLYRITMEMTEIQSLWGTNAIYRTKIPIEIEEHFQAHVEKKRRFYNGIMESSTEPKAEESNAKLVDLINSVSPTTVAGALEELKNRLIALKDQRKLLVSDDPVV